MVTPFAASVGKIVNMNVFVGEKILVNLVEIFVHQMFTDGEKIEIKLYRHFILGRNTQILANSWKKTDIRSNDKNVS